MKPVEFTMHSLRQMAERGALQEEVNEAIRTAQWSAAREGRLECRKDFSFNAVWQEKFFATKQVRPIFVDEPSAIVVVTVYVYYF